MLTCRQFEKYLEWIHYLSATWNSSTTLEISLCSLIVTILFSQPLTTIVLFSVLFFFYLLFFLVTLYFLFYYIKGLISINLFSFGLILLSFWHCLWCQIHCFLFFIVEYMYYTVLMYCILLIYLELLFLFLPNKNVTVAVIIVKTSRTFLILPYSNLETRHNTSLKPTSHETSS